MDSLSRLRIPGILAVALLGACGTDPGGTTIAITFDVCEPIGLIPAEGTSPAELDSIDAALLMWNRMGPYSLARLDGDTEGATLVQRIPIQFELAAPPFYGLYDDERGVIYVNRGIADQQQREVTLAHELGHAFGLAHISSEDRVSVMNPANRSTEPDAADAAELDALWGPCDGI